MSHKKKRSPHERRMYFLKKNACFALTGIGLIFSAHRWGALLFLLSMPFCFLYRCFFWWREDQKNSVKEKRIMLLAYFWRYGHALLLPPLIVVGSLLNHVFPARWIGYYALFYGVYTLLIALNMCKHFICGMQDANHQKMRPYARPVPDSQRDGIFIALFFIAMGLLLLRL